MPEFILPDAVQPGDVALPQQKKDRGGIGARSRKGGRQGFGGNAPRAAVRLPIKAPFRMGAHAEMADKFRCVHSVSSVCAERADRFRRFALLSERWPRRNIGPKEPDHAAKAITV